MPWQSKASTQQLAFNLQTLRGASCMSPVAPCSTFRASWLSFWPSFPGKDSQQQHVYDFRKRRMPPFEPLEPSKGLIHPSFGQTFDAMQSQVGQPSIEGRGRRHPGASPLYTLYHVMTRPQQGGCELNPPPPAIDTRFEVGEPVVELLQLLVKRIRVCWAYVPCRFFGWFF